MLIDQERRLIYCANPRTASNSTAEFLLRNGFKKVTHHDRYGLDIDMRADPHHWGLSQTPGDYSTLVTVRNPYDTLVSWYYKRDWGMPFGQEWLDELFATNARYLRHPRRLFMHDYGLETQNHVTMYYEMLKEDLSNILGIEYDKVDLGHLNKSEKRPEKPFAEHYTPEFRLYVADRFQYEFTYHQYPR